MRGADRRGPQNAGGRKRQPVSRALRLLSWMVDCEKRELGVREIAVGLGLPASTAHHILNSLIREGMVCQIRDGGYSLSLDFFRLAARAVTQWPLQRVAEVHLRGLVADCNETALFGVYDASRRSMMFTALVQSNHPLRYEVSLNQWFPLHVGAPSLAMLAHLPDEEAAAIIRSKRLKRFTSRTLTTSQELASQVKAIRRNAYARSIGHRIEGAVSIAAPVWSMTGVVGSVSLTIPEQRFKTSAEAKLARRVIKCADAITDDLGGSAAQRTFKERRPSR